MTTKVIRVDWETYKAINDYAVKLGMNIGDATRLLVEGGMAAENIDALRKECDALKAQLSSLKQELREIVSSIYGEDSLQDDENLLDFLWNLEHMLDARDDAIEKRDRLIASYRDMFSCSVCGKPMSWAPDDALGQALRKFVKDMRWGHSACVKSIR